MVLSGSLIPLLVTGLLAGVLAGVFGVGGGVIIVPALVYFLGFSQHKATGTSLAVLLPPIGLAAVLEYNRHGHVDLGAAVVVASGALVGAWAGAFLANKLPGPVLRLLFGVFVVIMGLYMIYGAARKMEWL